MYCKMWVFPFVRVAPPRVTAVDVLLVAPFVKVRAAKVFVPPAACQVQIGAVPGNAFGKVTVAVQAVPGVPA